MENIYFTFRFLVSDLEESTKEISMNQFFCASTHENQNLIGLLNRIQIIDFSRIKDIGFKV